MVPGRIAAPAFLRGILKVSASFDFRFVKKPSPFLDAPRLLEMIFGDVFAPEVVAYVTRRVHEILTRQMEAPDEQRQRVRVELARAQAELEHIAGAIRAGNITSTTRTMLEAAERLVADCEAALRALPIVRPTLPPIEETVHGYLSDLRDTLTTDVTAARELLARGVGTITLRPVDGQLVAEMRGNLIGLLGLEAERPNDGAGRGI